MKKYLLFFTLTGLFFEVLHASKRSHDQIDNYIAEIPDYIMDDEEVDVLTRAMQAIDNDEYEELRNLVRNNPHIIDEQNEKGNTLLHIAAFNDDDRAVRLLLRYHANPNIVDHQMNGALHAAAGCVNPTIVKLLLDAGADPNIFDEDGCTPLHRALQSDVSSDVSDEDNNTVKCIQELLNAGADPNILADDGYTALHIAAMYDDIPSIEALLNAGADPRIRNNADLLPRDIALAEEHNQAAQLLLPIQSSGLNFNSALIRGA